jgi:hypothetical protein
MDGNPYWDDFEAPSGTPADHKVRRDAVLRGAAHVPVPTGVDSIADSPPRVANAVRGADGSAVRFFAQGDPPHRRIYATVDHPEGYAEFTLDGATWRYLPQCVVMWSGYTSTFVDDLEADQVPVPPPTLADATREPGA